MTKFIILLDKVSIYGEVADIKADMPGYGVYAFMQATSYHTPRSQAS